VFGEGVDVRVVVEVCQQGFLSKQPCGCQVELWSEGFAQCGLAQEGYCGHGLSLGGVLENCYVWGEGVEGMGGIVVGLTLEAFLALEGVHN